MTLHRTDEDESTSAASVSLTVKVSAVLWKAFCCAWPAWCNSGPTDGSKHAVCELSYNQHKRHFITGTGCTARCQRFMHASEVACAGLHVPTHAVWHAHPSRGVSRHGTCPSARHPPRWQSHDVTNTPADVRRVPTAAGGAHGGSQAFGGTPGGQGRERPLPQREPWVPTGQLCQQ